MKKINCNCGRVVRLKIYNAFIFDGLQFHCKNCDLKFYGSGFGYQQAAEEIISKLKEAKTK